MFATRVFEIIMQQFRSINPSLHQFFISLKRRRCSTFFLLYQQHPLVSHSRWKRYKATHVEKWVVKTQRFFNAVTCTGGDNKKRIKSLCHTSVRVKWISLSWKGVERREVLCRNYCNYYWKNFLDFPEQQQKKCKQLCYVINFLLILSCSCLHVVHGSW